MKTKDTKIRNIPWPVWEEIIAEAERQHRSLNSQLLVAVIEHVKRLQAGRQVGKAIDIISNNTS